jgi:hypothetical protein
MAVRVAGGTSLAVATLRSADRAAMLRDAVAWVTSLLTNTRFSALISSSTRIEPASDWRSQPVTRSEIAIVTMPLRCSGYADRGATAKKAG